ncbi:MAG: response regulator [Acidobacteria bacterium]|nr:response regulator [Acidobacteriota bacterium]
MKTLLLVGRDRHSRDYLVRGVSGMMDEMQVLSARDGEEAARTLASGPVDILVTELIMPVMDGFELLSYVLDEHPGIEVVIMGETELGRTQQALCAGGAFRFLSKPVAVEDLIDVVRSILARPAKGRLTGLSLPGFLQLLNTEGRTCSLRVKALGHEGRVDMREGQLINASCNGAEGKEALFETLSWRNPEIEVEEPKENVARLIQDRLPSLLLEAALQNDIVDSAAVELAGHGVDSRPDPPVSIEVTGEARPADPEQEADAGQVVGSFSTFAAVPLQAEVAAAARGLSAFMRLEGTIGAGIIEFETGRSLAHVCRGRSSYFAKMASKAARAVREGMRQIGDADLRDSVSQLKLYGPEQFQLVRVVRSQPQLLLFFAGLVGRADVDTASDLLADFEGMILESSSVSVARPHPTA